MNQTKCNTIYVAGPMSGYPDHNIPAFKEATRRLREAGYTVICPTENHGTEEEMLALSWEECMRNDIAALASHCTGMAVLPGWTGSRGAKLEYRIATSLGIVVMSVEEWLGLPRTDPPKNISSIFAQIRAKSEKARDNVSVGDASPRK